MTTKNLISVQILSSFGENSIVNFKNKIEKGEKNGERWVTINGRHVLIGGDGSVKSGNLYGADGEKVEKINNKRSNRTQKQSSSDRGNSEFDEADYKKNKFGGESRENYSDRIKKEKSISRENNMTHNKFRNLSPDKKNELSKKWELRDKSKPTNGSGKSYKYFHKVRGGGVEKEYKHIGNDKQNNPIFEDENGDIIDKKSLETDKRNTNLYEDLSKQHSDSYSKETDNEEDNFTDEHYKNDDNFVKNNNLKESKPKFNKNNKYKNLYKDYQTIIEEVGEVEYNGKFNIAKYINILEKLGEKYEVSTFEIHKMLQRDKN